jgi:hypothetical protein
MANTMAINTIDLEFPFGQELELFCPVCGSVIFETDQVFENPQCAHVEWVYLDEISEFVFAQPALQSKIDSLCATADDDDDFDLRAEQGCVHHHDRRDGMWSRVVNGSAGTQLRTCPQETGAYCNQQ